MRRYSSRQKAVLAAAGMALALIAGACLTLLLGPGRREDPARARTIQTIPDAEQAESPQSKKDAYTKGARDISCYWDSLEESYAAQDAGRDSPLPGPGGRMSPAITSDDITSGTQDTGAMQERPAGRTIRDDPQRQAILKAIEDTERMRGGDSTASASVEEPEPERMKGMQASIRRTGEMSSLEDGLTEDLGTGFSSLDVQDADAPVEGHPYRCMFCRDEKVKSGQRVPVRILEDMVVGGSLVPRNTRLSAVCTVGKRMEVSISTVEINGRIYAVDFDGYDTDGTRGIYCSDLVESARRLRSQSLSTAGSILSGRSMVSVARDAASVGLAIAQSASGENTVSIPAGYVFYLVERRQ